MNIPWLKKIIWVIGVLRRTVVSDNNTNNTNNSPSQDSHHPDDLSQSRYVTPGFKPFSYFLNILFIEMNARSRKRIFFWCYWIYNARKWKLLDEFEFCETLMKVLQLNCMFTILQISLWRVHFAKLNADWRKWTYFRIIFWLLVQMIAYFL